jgi:UDP-4-amino-4-deoxy-L-arabinose-oxoglutarate aminotransferase
MLLPQMDRLEENWSKRRELARLYEERLRDIPDLSRPATLAGVNHAWHLFPVWVEAGQRDRVIQELQNQGISVMVNYRAIHLLTYYRNAFGFREGDFPIAEKIGDASLSLPFYPNMPREHVDNVTKVLREVLQR